MTKPTPPENKALRDAAMALYEAGKWDLVNNAMPQERQALLWEALRDALGLPEGHATKGGFHKAQEKGND